MTLAVRPVITSARMVAQRATFTLSGDSFDPLEERYPGCITKILLPASGSRDIHNFLEIIGEGHFSYFPDLGGLADELADELKQELEAALSWIKTNEGAASDP